MTIIIILITIIISSSMISDEVIITDVSSPYVTLPDVSPGHERRRGRPQPPARRPRRSGLR